MAELSCVALFTNSLGGFHIEYTYLMGLALPCESMDGHTTTIFDHFLMASHMGLEPSC